MLQRDEGIRVDLFSHCSVNTKHMTNFDDTIANTRAHLLSLRNAQGHWEGELSSSALSTATAVVALALVDSVLHEALIARGARWLMENQNNDGGWGDTTISKSNLSTTLLCWSALGLYEHHVQAARDRAGPITGRVPVERMQMLRRCETWIREHVGSLEPDAISRAVIACYGKDKTFSVPILMACAISGRLGPRDEAWRRVLTLPFELAAFPRSWFGAIGLPVVSYALPALIAIGHARFHHAPPRWWNPLRWIRAALWPRISPMLKTLQPGTGGYLEATPLTSFVTMALACAGEKHHPCVPEAVRFLIKSQRDDGSWAIDTNLATWATTLAVKALCASSPGFSPNLPCGLKPGLHAWLLSQQYQTIHPFTNAAPGGWAWTNLSGGVPDADDTSGALIALWHLCESDNERQKILPAIEAGILWLLDLQNRDGGIPTFCRGWGTLPFDRSTPEITAHALHAFSIWNHLVRDEIKLCILNSEKRAVAYLNATQHDDGSWIPLWFGNEHAPGENNPVHGTAMVVQALADGCRVNNSAQAALQQGVDFLIASQHPSGGWGGARGVDPTVEETANAVQALAACLNLLALSDSELKFLVEPVQRGARWLIEQTQNGMVFPAAPIGLYFARLWYHEKTYPVIWTLAALEQARLALND